MSYSEHLGVALGVGTVLIPVAMYFLVLGLLNTRRRPQMLSARTDFALLVVALSPMFAVPVLNYLGVSVLSVLLTAVVVAFVAVALAPRGGSWVIYNMPSHQARSIIDEIAGPLGLSLRPRQRGPFFSPRRPFVQISSFPILRNVTVRLPGASDELTRRFEHALSRKLSSVRAQACPMGTVMLMVATGMLALPLALVAGRADEIVRLLTDLLD